MRSVRLAVVATAVLSLGAALTAPHALADDRPSKNKTSYTNLATYCADVQTELARLKPGSATITTVLYDDTTVEGTRVGYRAFRSSKALVDGASRTITVRQWVVRDAAGNPVQVMCKTKAQDALLPALGASSFSGPQSNCTAVTSTILKRSFGTLSSKQREAAEDAYEETVVDPAEYDEFGGNLWTLLGYQTFVTDADGDLHLRSQGLYTPLDPNTPLSNAFIDLLNSQFGLSLPYGTTNGDMVAAGLTDPLTLGVHYCTVPAVSAVQAALLA